MYLGSVLALASVHQVELHFFENLRLFLSPSEVHLTLYVSLLPSFHGADRVLADKGVAGGLRADVRRV